MQKTTDMTHGKPLGLLLRFAWPLMLGSLCQILYSVADGTIVGRVAGIDAFAAIGAANFLSLLVFQIVVGITQGFGVIFAQRFGRQNYADLRSAVGTAIVLAAIVSIVLCVSGIVLSRSILQFMHTPAELLDGAHIYACWMYGGTAVTMANRLFMTLLLALGNSRAPVVANIAACALNVLLDLLFAGAFQWGVAGVAAATVAAQAGSAAYLGARIWNIQYMRLTGHDMQLSHTNVEELLHLGIPMGFRDGVIAVGGLFVQAAINANGTLFVAGMAAGEKFFELIAFTGSAFEGAFSTYSAQNFGAGKMLRIKRGLRCSILLSLAGAAIVAVLVAWFGKDLIRLLFNGPATDIQRVVQTGSEYLLILALTVPLMFLLCIYRAGLQGMGYALVPMLSGFVELGIRILSVLYLPTVMGKWAVYLASPLGWLGAMMLLCISYHISYRNQMRLHAQSTPTT